MVRSDTGVAGSAAYAAALCCAALGVTLPATAPAQNRGETPVACGGTYRIQPGDTIFGIANRRVQPPITVGALTRANPGALADPANVAAGVEIAIPCAPGTAPQVAPGTTTAARGSGDRSADDRVLGAVEAESARTATTATPDAQTRSRSDTPDSDSAPAAGSPAEPLRIDILTGSSLAPFIDSLPDDGATTRVVDAVLGLMDGHRVHVIDVVDDWSAHLHVLLQRGKYDLAYPHARPDCSYYDDLGQAAQWRCDNLQFSAPIGTARIAYYMRASETVGPTEPILIWGKRLCRPSGHFTHDLVVRDLAPPFVNWVEAPTAADCIDRLVEGSVDVVSVETRIGTAAIAARGAADAVMEIEALASTETLHLVGMRANQHIAPLMRDFDRGLAERKASATVAQGPGGAEPLP